MQLRTDPENRREEVCPRAFLHRDGQITAPVRERERERERGMALKTKISSNKFFFRWFIEETSWWVCFVIFLFKEPPFLSWSNSRGPILHSYHTLSLLHKSSQALSIKGLASPSWFLGPQPHLHNYTQRQSTRIYMYGRKLGLKEIAKAAIMAKVFKDGSRAENAFVHHLEVYSDSPVLGWVDLLLLLAS